METITNKTKVKFYSFSGEEKTGKVVALEPYPLDETLAYVYIMDDEYTEDGYKSAMMQNADSLYDVSYECHTDIVNGIPIKYTDMRVSNEVFPIDE